MQSADRKTYCCICKASTVWRHEEGQYACIGDDDRHPERRVHGCGTKVPAERFMRRNSNGKAQQ